MHGLVFVTWEKYIAERFQGSVLNEYREVLRNKLADLPLTSRVYKDEALLAGIKAVSQLTGVSVETLLREYGRYFLVNGLTRHLCAYLLTQSHSGRDLLLAMHDAHEQMTRLPDGLAPPLFEYRTRSEQADELIVIYDSPRQLCSLLRGAIEGAAERYGEKVHLVEQTCMKRGDAVCRFQVRFSSSSVPQETTQQEARHQTKRQFAQLILLMLPQEGGISLTELQNRLILRGVSKRLARPALLLEALQHLHHAGLVATTANEPGDEFFHRRYWRARVTEQAASAMVMEERTDYAYH
jgi:hypothetical protein